MVFNEDNMVFNGNTIHIPSQLRSLTVSCSKKNGVSVVTRSFPCFLAITKMSEKSISHI